MTRNNITAVIHPNWLNTTEGEAVLKELYDSFTSSRKIFGILEKPAIKGNFEEVSYKLFFVGKSGVGKSKTVAELAGRGSHLQDSHGIHKTNIFWPTKIWDRVILFRLHCWEADESGIKKFSHILPACLEKADALVFIFSFEDVNSFYDISQNIIKLKSNEQNQPAIMVIGTRYSPSKNCSISFADIKEFETKWRLNILRIQESVPNQRDIRTVGPILNAMCEQLWIRDQEYILKQF